MNHKWWWGYLHKDGSIRLGRWFGDFEDYTTDCCNNEFVLQVIAPFIADNKEEASEHIHTILNIPRDLNKEDENIFKVS